jgi:hypothetical protein
VEQSKLNPFTGDDYNKINKSVKQIWPKDTKVYTQNECSK